MNAIWTIKDSEDNYVTANRCFILTDEGWFYCSFTGLTTGFTFYSNELTAKRELEELRNFNNKYNFGKKFYLEYIDIKKIPNGKRNIEKLKNNNKLNFCFCAK